ncbi:MAG: hypothetical protein M3348_08420 [Acidobacteriota bacterium]|nr:hypothetical protein [Acidobacteriota bacterium]
MERQYIKSVEGSPRPSDIFQPHMPGVDVLSNIDEIFGLARSELLNAESVIENSVAGQRAVAIVTPGRMIMYQACPPPGSLSDERIEGMKKAMPPGQSLNISVVSYTLLEALTQDTTKTKCIPFLGILLAYAYIGHSVVVFEGHPSAFESGVRDSDTLIVDSGMLPFIQDDWAEVAYKTMRPGAKLYIHKRETYTLMPVARSDNAQGWQYSEPDGEASYANCLLMMLAKGKRPSAQVTSGQPLPDLADFTTDPEDLDWIKGLPFRYDRLDADEVTRIILHAAGWRRHHFFKTKGVLNARLADESKKLKMVSFTLTLTKDDRGRRLLQIER